MRNRSRLAWAAGLVILAACAANMKADSASEGGQNTLVITLTDGQQRSFPAADIARLELKGPAAVVFRDGHRENLEGNAERIEFRREGAVMGQNHFLGKWKCGDGIGGTFYITLQKNGVARKSMGDTGGTWKIVDGEARITWDDGWKDIIRKVGNKHEKAAFGPGKSFSDSPSNVTNANNESALPL